MHVLQSNNQTSEIQKTYPHKHRGAKVRFEEEQTLFVYLEVTIGSNISKTSVQNKSKNEKSSF